MSLVNILQQVELFRGLSVEQLSILGTITQQELFQTGEFICRQGDKADKLYVISSGQVEIAIQANQGHSEAMVYLGTGQVVGEMTLVDEGRRSASVIAADDNTQVLSIPNQALYRLCEEDTKIGFIVMRNIAQDLSFKLRHHDYEAADSD